MCKTEKLFHNLLGHLSVRIYLVSSENKTLNFDVEDTAQVLFHHVMVKFMWSICAEALGWSRILQVCNCFSL